MIRKFGLRAALSLLVLIAIAPVFAVVVQASLIEQQSRLERAQADLRSVVDLGAAYPERLIDGAQAAGYLRKLTLSPEWTLLVADAEGIVMASAGRAAVPVGSGLPAGFLRQAVASGLPRFERAAWADGGEWLYVVQPIGRPGERKLFVAGTVSSTDLLAPSAQRLQLQLGALALIALLGALAAWIFGDRLVARPISRMLQTVDALHREELRLDTPPATRGPSELRELDQRVHEMARGLAERSVQRDGAMAEMAGQKNLLESILESMAEGVLVIDRRGRFVHTNAAAHRIMAGAAELNRQKDPTRVPALEWGLFHLDGVTPVDPEDRPAVRTLAGENLDNYRYVIRGRLSGGPEKIIQGHTRVLLSPQGEQYGAVLVFSDITAAYRAEEALKDSERRYRTLFESNPHPMWVFDVETLRFLTVNDAAVAHYGYSLDEFLAMTIKDIRPQEDVAPLLDAVDDGYGLHSPLPWRHRLRDGRLIYVEISSHTLDYGGRRARMVLAHDITQRRLAQQALEHVNETLERRVGERTRELAVSNRELESFAYSVSHDLRAPLQVIDGFGRALLAKHAQQLDERGRHYLARIRENTSQMGDLIDDLLSLARVTRAEIKAERVDLAPKAAQIIERLRQRYPDREVEFEIDRHVTCSGDARLLAVVLENLLENAWKFTARTAKARIRVGLKAGENGESVVYVADNGAGFDMAYVGKLFNAFQRLHPASEFEGTGIGLATVHRIITRHGGRVWAESSPGQGTVFQFTLKAGANDEKQQDSSGRGQSGPSGTHPDDAGREQCAQ